jgi:radical SAM superfamily enzyme YgiQ (UPF0313 family)
MKTLILNAPQFIAVNTGRKFSDVRSDDILSIGYLASYARSRGHDVTVADMYAWPWKKVEDFISSAHPDVVAIACSHTDDRGSAYAVARFVKRLGSRIKVVFGGHHASAMAAQIVRHLPVDAVVVGEGEETFEELIRVWREGGGLRSVSGLVFMDGDEVVETPRRSPIENLDSLPFPLRGEIHGNRTLATGTYPPALLTLKYKGASVGSRIFASIITSRGCPFKCRFCSATGFWGARWRMRSPRNVVDEIEELVRCHGVQHIEIADDIFTLQPERTIEICREIVGRGLEITWDAMTRVDSVSEDLASWMRKSGCVWTSFGIETGSDSVMRNLNKNIDNERVLKAFDIFRRQGIATVALMMVGNPGETGTSIGETKKLLRRIRPQVIIAAKTTVMPATELYEKAKAAGLIDDDFWLTDAPPPSYTVEHSEARLNRWADAVAGATTFPLWKLLRGGMFGSRAARFFRDWFAARTGIRFSRKGLQFGN